MLLVSKEERGGKGSGDSERNYSLTPKAARGKRSVSFAVLFPRYFALLKFPGHEAFYTKRGTTFWTAVTRRTDTAERVQGSGGCVLWKIARTPVVPAPLALGSAVISLTNVPRSGLENGRPKNTASPVTCNDATVYSIFHSVFVKNSYTYCIQQRNT